MNPIPEKTITVKEYFLRIAEKLETAGRLSTGRNYRKTYRSFAKYEGKQDYMMHELDSGIVKSYNNFLVKKGILRNTVSFYNRILRALYRLAIKDGYVIPDVNDPFAEVYTGVDRTLKRALDIKVLRRITSLKLSESPELCFARDLFVFSFYARGMCFVDMAYLTWDKVDGDNIQYVRSKTQKNMYLHLEPCMLEIMNRYRSQCFGNYVFPIITSDDPTEAFKDYEYHLQRHNLMLKEIGKRLKIAFPLCSYAARHSWATTARNSHVPISVISASMGHSCEKTTRIYLAELDQTIIDSANHNIITRLTRML